MKRTLLIPIFLLVNIVAFAQQNNTTPSGYQPPKAVNRAVYTGHYDPLFTQAFNNRYEGIKGTPFFLDSWGVGQLELNNNTLYEGLKLKYNVVENTLEVLDKEGIRLTIKAEHLNNFSIIDSAGLNKYSFKKFNAYTGVDQSLKDKFYQTLYEGKKASLVALPSKTFVKAEYSGAYNMGRTADEFINMKVYFFMKENKDLQKLKLNRRNLMLVLNDKKEEIKEFLNKQRIDASTENGWVLTLAHYETL